MSTQKEVNSIQNISGSNPYLQELKKVDKMKWASIHCALNRWEFPEELIQLKPDWWIDNKADKRKPEIITPINNHIELTLGRRWISREWNKELMTEEEHNKWWIKHCINP